MFKHINRLNLNLQKIFDTQLAQSWASWSIKLHALVVAGNRIQSSTTSVRTFFTRNSLQRSTTSTVMSSNMEQGEWQQRKKQIAAMSTEKRRKFYRCTPDQIVMLSDIPTWYDYGRIKKLFVEDSGDDDDEKAVELAKKASLFAGDITQLEIDAIVNAANNSLLGGGGVDGAIHKAAGDMLYDECETLNGCDTGDVKITGGYNLPAKFVMHAVGPRGSGDEELASCYLKSLQLARENNVRSIAFPCISTGIYGFPNRRACQLALHTIREWLLQDDNFDNITRIIFCVFLPVDVRLYEQYLPKYFPLTKSPDAETSAAAGNEISPEKQPSPRKDVAGTPKKAERPDSSSDAERENPEEKMEISPRKDAAAGSAEKPENPTSAADAASSAERLETSSHMDDAGNVGKDESSQSDVAVDAARTATATSPSPSKEKK